MCVCEGDDAYVETCTQSGISRGSHCRRYRSTTQYGYSFPSLVDCLLAHHHHHHHHFGEGVMLACVPPPRYISEKSNVWAKRNIYPTRFFLLAYFFFIQAPPPPAAAPSTSPVASPFGRSPRKYFNRTVIVPSSLASRRVITPCLWGERGEEEEESDARPSGEKTNLSDSQLPPPSSPSGRQCASAHKEGCRMTTEGSATPSITGRHDIPMAAPPPLLRRTELSQVTLMVKRRLSAPWMYADADRAYRSPISGMHGYSERGPSEVTMAQEIPSMVGIFRTCFFFLEL